MSVPVELEGLVDRIDEFGPVAYLLTTNDDLSPHAASVVVDVDAEGLTTSAGRTSTTNAARSTTVTLLWPPAPDGPYSLIVDAEPTGTASEGRIRLAPQSAILHRVAGRDDDGPTCVPVSEGSASGSQG